MKHDFQNNFLRFAMHKIVVGIAQKKIVGSGQLLVTASWARAGGRPAGRGTAGRGTAGRGTAGRGTPMKICVA